MVTIVNYGSGNINSIKNMFNRIGVDSLISSSEKDLEEATHLVLPGVGAFDNGMIGLKERNLIDVLTYKVLEERTPILGICLGAQLMTESSEEGKCSGLGWLPAMTVKFKHEKEQQLPLPNIGWRVVKEVAADFNLTSKTFDNRLRYYFVHNYHFRTSNEKIVWMTSEYGYEYPCALAKDNIYCVQFHPEKSHSYGIVLLEKFLKL